jgi:hypothetical protein
MLAKNEEGRVSAQSVYTGVISNAADSFRTRAILTGPLTPQYLWTVPLQE